MASANAHVWFDEHDLTVVLEGDLAASAESVLEAVAHAHADRLTIDLTRVTSVDGAGIGALMAIAEAAENAGIPVRYGQAVATRGQLIDLRAEEAAEDQRVR